MAANRYLGPGDSLRWRNETGRDVENGEIVRFGGGLAAITRCPAAAGAVGQVTLSGLWEIDAPDGLDFAPGDVAYAADGRLAATGDILGRAVTHVLPNGRVRVLLGHAAGGGGGGAGAPATTLKEGRGIALTTGRNPQGGLDYTVNLNLNLESESDNLTIESKETTP